MLTLYQSNRTENLVSGLLQVVAEPLQHPLTPEIIVVPDPGTARWLSLRLAEGSGICANTRFPLPAGFIWERLRALLKDAPETSQFEPAILQWRIQMLLDELVEDPRFAPVLAYIAGADEVKRHALATRIADLFDQYLVYRPDWILAWESGRSAVAGDDWQAELWRRLAVPQAGVHWVHLLQRLSRAMARADLPVANLPSRVSLFGVRVLSPGFLEVLHQLSQWMEVHFFLLNPCREYWTDIVSTLEKEYREARNDSTALYLEVGNPLLASLGRQGRDFFALILDYDPGSVETFEDPGRDSLLHSIQSDILNLDEPQAVSLGTVIESAPSLQFHSCHSPMREVEVLHDQLLDILRHSPDLQPSDVLVMTPDMGTYAPYIDSVFGDRSRRPPIPYQISMAGADLESPIVGAFFKLLQIPGSRFDTDSLLALLEVPAVQRRFRIAAGELPDIVRWIRETGIRWGRDAAFRVGLGLPATADNTWQAGLDRLLLGYALPGDDETLFQGVLPYDVEGPDARLVGALHAFVEAVSALDTGLTEARPMEAWVEVVQRLLDRFFDPVGEEGFHIQSIRDEVETLTTQVRRAGFTGAFSLDLLRTSLEPMLRRASSSRFFGGSGVRICAFGPQGTQPVAVICLIGMNDRAFPRLEKSPGFDLMEYQSRFGDRSKRADDRYLFLETLMSARRCLYLSFTGQDIRDNTQIPPSVLISELLDYVAKTQEAGDSQAIREKMLKRHPLQAFDRCYFLSDSKHFSYNEEMCSACVARAMGTKQPEPFLTSALAPPEPEWQQVTLEQLLEFFSNPTRYLLKRRLGILLAESDPLPDTREPFQMDFFEGIELTERLVQKRLADDPTDSVRLLFRAQGRLPHGQIGDRLFRRCDEQAAAFASRVREKFQVESTAVFDLALDFGEKQLRGRLQGLGTHGFFGYSPHKLWDFQLLHLWIRHLALNASAPAAVSPVTEWIDSETHYHFRPLADAHESLAGLLDLYWQGLSRPLHFFPKSAREFMQQDYNDKPPDYCMAKAETKWLGSPPDRVGESSNPYYQLAFPGGDVLDREFIQLSRAIYGPLFECLEV